MRGLPILFAISLLCAGCGKAKPPFPTSPTNPPGGGGTNGVSFAGSWVGSVTDSSGSLMGTGIGNPTTSFMWQLNQNGSQVTGTISVAGSALPPGQPAPAVTGIVSGSTMTFTASVTASSVPTGMPAPAGTCAATATGTLTMSASGNSMTGNYTGTSSCTGGFANGVITLARQ